MTTTEQAGRTETTAARAHELRTRAPLFTVRHPTLLVESTATMPGEWLSAQLAASDRVGDVFWLDVADGDGDAYSTYPGNKAVMIEHSGLWYDRQGTGLVDQVTALDAELRATAHQAEMPPVLVVSTESGLWHMCKRWAEWRSTNSNEAKATLHGVRRRNSRQRNDWESPPNPNATIAIGENLWNDAHARHRALMDMFMNMPAIVVLHAHTGVYADGTEYVEAHNDVIHRVHAHVRVPADTAPVIVSAKHYNHYREHRHGNHAKPAEDLTLEAVIFDVLEFEHVRPAPPQETP